MNLKSISIAVLQTMPPHRIQGHFRIVENPQSERYKDGAYFQYSPTWDVWSIGWWLQDN